MYILLFIIYYILHITPLPIPTLWHDNNYNYCYILKRIWKNDYILIISLLMHLHINIVPRYLTCVNWCVIYTCHNMITANSNSFIHNTGLTEENSLVHLLDAISPQEENEADIIEHSKYYDDKDFNNALQLYNSKISKLSLNCQSISAKFDKLKLFLDDVNNQNPISCIQETWGHEGIQMNYFSLPNYILINANRRLTAHGGLIMYIHNDFEFKELNEEFPITHTSNSFQSLFVEVWRKNYSNQKYVIGNIYRLPLYDSDNLTSFTNEYIDILNTLRNRSKLSTCVATSI